VTEEDFETTEGEVQDLYDKHMEMGGWRRFQKPWGREWLDLILIGLL
jgi:hypothetical protein